MISLGDLGELTIVITLNSSLQDCRNARSLVGTFERSRAKGEHEGATGDEHSNRVPRQ